MASYADALTGLVRPSAAPDCAVMARSAMPASYGRSAGSRKTSVRLGFAEYLGFWRWRGTTAPGPLKNNPSKVLMLLQQILFQCQSSIFKTAAGAEKFQDHAADDAIGRHWHLMPPSTAARRQHLTQVPAQVRQWSLEGRWADAGGALSTAGIRQGTDDGDCCLDAQLQRSAAGGSCEISCVK